MQDGLNVHNGGIFRRCIVSAAELLLTTQRDIKSLSLSFMRKHKQDVKFRRVEKPQEYRSQEVESAMKVTDTVEAYLRIKDVLEDPVDVSFQIRQTMEASGSFSASTSTIDLYSEEEIRSLHDVLTKTVRKLDMLKGDVQPQYNPQMPYYPPGVRTPQGQTQIIKNKHGETMIVNNPTSPLVRTADSFNRVDGPTEPLELPEPMGDDDDYLVSAVDGNPLYR
jgi:hypothetical protein